MKHLISQLIKKPFVKSVIVMASGTATAQAIALLASPIITRLYGPEAYGVMGVFQSTAQILVPIAALTYPIAIVLPRSDQDAKGLMRLSRYVTLVFSILLFFILLFFNKSIVSLFNIQQISSFMLLLPLIVLFSGFMQINEQWLIRTKQFKIVARADVYRSFLVNAGRIGIGFYYPLSSVLVFFTTIGNGIKTLMMEVYLRNSNYILNDKIKNRMSLKALLKKYKDFPVYRAPESLIKNTHQSMPVLLLTLLFGPISAGYFTISKTVLGVPSRLIGKSISDVFYPRISEAANNKEHTTKLIIKATFAMGITGLIPYGIIMIIGPWLFSFVFGSDWAIAGEYARWMAFWFFCMFLSSPSNKALPVFFAQAFQLKYTIFTLVIRLVAFILGYYLFSDALIAIAFFSIAAGILSIGLILFTLRISQKFGE